MQNNFEKNVQQKMDGLKLTPSATVWERVELEIKPERKKRRGIFWLLFVGLLFSGAWLLQQTFDDNFKEANGPHHEATAEAPIMAIDTAENKQSNGPGKASPPINLSVTKGAATVDEKTKPIKISSFTTKRKASFETQPSGVTMKTSSHKKPQAAPVVITAKTDAAPIESKNTKAVPTLDSTVAQTTSTSSLNIDSIAMKEEKVALPPGIDSTAKNKDSVLKKKVASANKWRRRLNFGAGISGYAKGPFFQSFNSSRDALYAASLSSPGAPVMVSTQPSPTRSGFAFSLGFSVVKSLSQRWELSIGLQYAYASTHQKVGDRKTADTTVQFAMDKAATSGFYTNAATTDYAARFHFVELPVSLSFKPLLHAPLYISLGAAYGRLLQTNALTFSSASNLYYQNKDNYLRNAVNISSSIQVAVLSKTGLSLCTGPFVQYNAIKLRRENSNGTPHLISAGIKTAIIF